MILAVPSSSLFLFFFNDTATTEIYTLSLHDALPICIFDYDNDGHKDLFFLNSHVRSEEHTSELQSLRHLVCRLLLEKKNKPKRLKGMVLMSRMLRSDEKKSDIQ